MVLGPMKRSLDTDPQEGRDPLVENHYSKEKVGVWFGSIQSLAPCPTTRQKQRSYLRGPHIQAPLLGPQPHLPHGTGS